MQVAVMERYTRTYSEHVRYDLKDFKPASPRQLLQVVSICPPSVKYLLANFEEYSRFFTDNAFEQKCLGLVGRLALRMQYEGTDWLVYYMSVTRVFDGCYIREETCLPEERDMLRQICQDKDLQKRLMFLVVWELSQLRSKQFMQQVHAYHLKFALGVEG